MKISARNKFVGKVKHITHGTVNSEVIIALPGGQELVSVITETSVQYLKLKTGSRVVAFIKASNVLLAVP
ncbi:MAG: TOBE domain-containing protein [Candidatus Brocadiia bacterium]|jgi:molybdopterin-binding protein